MQQYQYHTAQHWTELMTHGTHLIYVESRTRPAEAPELWDHHGWCPRSLLTAHQCHCVWSLVLGWQLLYCNWRPHYCTAASLRSPVWPARSLRTAAPEPRPQRSHATHAAATDPGVRQPSWSEPRTQCSRLSEWVQHGVVPKLTSCPSRHRRVRSWYRPAAAAASAGHCSGPGLTITI